MFGVTFVTNTGTRSPQLGGLGGIKSSTYVVPGGKRLAGIFGRMDPKINGLGFYLAPARRRINRKLPLIGYYNKGTKFEWVAQDNNATLEKIYERNGRGIHKIKFYMNNGETSPALGGYGGFSYIHTIPAGQHIVSASFNTSIWLTSVTFKTNEG